MRSRTAVGGRGCAVGALEPEGDVESFVDQVDGTIADQQVDVDPRPLEDELRDEALALGLSALRRLAAALAARVAVRTEALEES